MISQQAIDRLEYVPNGPFRELAHEAIRLGSSWSKLARAMDFTCKNRHGELRGDCSRLKRMVGATSQKQDYIRYETAVKFVRVMGRDPVDYGI